MRKNSNETHEKQKVEKKREKARCGSLPKGATNTIRSKIEDKLTEEKLKDRENAAYPNTPWAPSGPERISCQRQMFRSRPLKRCYKRGCIFCWGALGILRLLAKGVVRTTQNSRMFVKIDDF